MVIDLPEEITSSYDEMRVLPDGRICGVHRLMFHWTMHVDIDPVGYAEHYCFATKELALKALHEWDGIGDPEGWHRHPKTGRRRNIETGEEWIAL
jgi:hypothetical protein